MALWYVMPASIHQGRREAGGETLASIVEAKDAKQAAERFLSFSPLEEQRYYNNGVVVCSMYLNDKHILLTQRNLPIWFGIRQGKPYRLPTV